MDHEIAVIMGLKGCPAYPASPADTYHGCGHYQMVQKEYITMLWDGGKGVHM